MEKVFQELFWVHFLCANTVQTVLKYIWMRHWYTNMYWSSKLVTSGESHYCGYALKRHCCNFTGSFHKRFYEVFSKTWHFEKEKKNVLHHIEWTQSQNQKEKKNVVMLASSRPMHSATKDDEKSKLQIVKFYNSTKGSTDIVDQLNDYYSSRAKLLRWIMMDYIICLT